MIKSLEYLHSRCKEDADCLLWEGSTDGGGRPKLSIKVDGLTKTQQPRRMVWTQAKGAIPAKRYVTVTCDNPLCLNPEHMKLVTRGQVTAREAKRPDTHRRRYLGGLKSRERSSLDMDKVRYIRQSNKTLEAISQEMGIAPTTASAIRRNKRWREFHNNPFAGL